MPRTAKELLEAGRRTISDPFVAIRVNSWAATLDKPVF